MKNIVVKIGLSMLGDFDSVFEEQMKELVFYFNNLAPFKKRDLTLNNIKINDIDTYEKYITFLATFSASEVVSFSERVLKLFEYIINDYYDYEGLDVPEIKLEYIGIDQSGIVKNIYRFKRVDPKLLFKMPETVIEKFLNTFLNKKISNLPKSKYDFKEFELYTDSKKELFEFTISIAPSPSYYIPNEKTVFLFALESFIKYAIKNLRESVPNIDTSKLEKYLEPFYIFIDEYNKLLQNVVTVF